MYDDELILISMQYTSDEIGNQVPNLERRAVLCYVRSIGRSEFYAAATTDLKPEVAFVVNKWDYNKENVVEYNGERYKVLREFPFPGTHEEIELTCELERAGGNDAD